MTYNKPTIEVLGEAVRVIQSFKSGNPGDGGPGSQATVTPAYELDE